MKLKNLLFATMFACAFASCSSDDDNSNPVVTPEGDGVAEIMVNPDLLRGNIESKASTKADVDPSVYENYKVYVFNRETGANLGHGIPGEVFKVTKNPGSVDIMVVGNVERANLTGSETKKDLFDKSIVFADLEECGEISTSSGSTETTSQSSSIYTFNLQNEVINKIGYPSAGAGEFLVTSTPIKVYRHVAKIVLNNITVKEKPIQATDGKEVVYANPSVDVKRVFILNAQNSTKIAAAPIWGTVFNEGVVMGSVSLEQYNKWVQEARAEQDKDKVNIKPYVPVDEDKKADNYVEHVKYNSEAQSIKGEINYAQTSGKTFNTDNSFYVYESTNASTNPTLLVVEADFKYTDNNKQPRTESGYYTVELGKKELEGLANLSSDFPGATAEMGVRRNIQYKINLSIMAPGSTNPLYPNPKVAGLDTQIELVNYGEVNSTTEFE